ncbi:uncharacterized protein L969DRAFT_77860 [Mixia osmundae IAM 14324]|uniref:Enoyl reductase (ER) domain-containing protein n=1 Tax=Mixia osmundae (strain CBS 9802 / IAM 14324 / JCM 22182 / KY 12970) TaxID=764103 RepID=G7E4Q9_MIXOS|nr:uncharacterized protein L969DRAFT_77860 [Mixia osmundae IAM 14324]KEI37641.1 hypothetical protein L969DRAFT_77860 [Mixia osmundae IAM 14324]GAA97819.1 hypothetical protein E5Q_04498 [Mixia osmundae IAM 14324]
MRALVLEKSKDEKIVPGAVWHPISVRDVEQPTPEEGEVLIRILAVAYNHRDLFIRRSQYPGITFPSILGADGVGILESPQSHSLKGKLVLIAPHENWLDSPLGPEQVNGKRFGILGGTRDTAARGTFADFICVQESHVVSAPAHLANEPSRETLAQLAAIPLGGLTAYRALFTKGNVRAGTNVLITGIGGGVALQALQYAVAIKANVYVTSGSQAKLDKAIELGAQGGVSYRDDSWPKALGKLLPKDHPEIDVVIDSAGGEIVNQLARILTMGATVVCYGQTTGEAIQLSMAAVLKNIDVKGSTMGSLREFKEAVAFIEKHKIVPIVHKILDGLDAAEEGFEIMDKGSQFGKICLITDKTALRSKL